MARKKRKPPVTVQPGEKPTREQLAKGDYHRDFVTHVETATKAMAHISAQEPVERWKRDGRLSDTQLAAIAFTRRLWAILGAQQKVTASYGERIPASASNEHLALRQIEAREDLHRISGYVPHAYWCVFENVCRFDEPAGVAGSRLGYGSRSARDRAHTVVCFVADIIAMKENLR